MKGFDYCIAHFERSPRTLAKPGRIVVPLLEDHSAIQLMCTKIMSSALNHELDPIDGRLALAAAKIAAFTLPRPPRMKESDKPAPAEESVFDFLVDEEGNWIGPRQAYRGPNNTFEPQWSAAKYMFERDCIRYGTPLPESAADFPECGWLTEEEMKMDPREWTVRQNRRLDAVLAEAKKVEAARAKVRDEKKQQADKEAGIEPVPAPKPLRHGEALGYYDPIPESVPAKKPAASATASGKAQPTAASDPSTATESEPTHPPFPTPGVPMTCPDEEDGVCWCGGPNQQFPCEPCRLKRDANNGSRGLDLKATADPCPNPGARKARRSSIRCPLTADPSSPVVESVNTAKNRIPNTIKTVTREKATLSRFSSHRRTNTKLPLLSNKTRNRAGSRDPLT
jgi:hypothetical protein